MGVFSLYKFELILTSLCILEGVQNFKKVSVKKQLNIKFGNYVRNSQK